MSSDTELQQKIIDELDWEPSVNSHHINVAVKDGIATLSGYVTRFSDKKAAEQSAKRVANAAAILGLEPYLKRYPRHLSGGQRQRVAMGRAIVRNPAVFLFDEPLSNLDAKLRVQMRSEIKQNHQRLKTTTVYVTHDQIEAMTMADRIVVMHDGIIEQIGTPLELYDRPANLFVATFIGSPAMNLLNGKMEGQDFIASDGFTRKNLPVKFSMTRLRERAADFNPRSRPDCKSSSRCSESFNFRSGCSRAAGSATPSQS